MKILFEDLQLRQLKIRNRIVVSPMCQYSAVDGVAQDWHFVHLGSFAVGGAGLVIAEATGVSPEGRISPGCLGLWSEKHADALRPIVSFIQSQGAAAGVQLAHAGRKGSTSIPWKGGGKALSPTEGGWETLAPSAVGFYPTDPKPKEMTKADMKRVSDQFVAAAGFAQSAGFDVIELHMAHGYLMNEFLSPLSNCRRDEYGGSRENRMRFPLEVTRAVRSAWPHDKPMFVRISSTEWIQGGWDVEDSVALVKELKAIGVDLIDVSTGGNSPDAKIPVGPGYQVPMAEQIRRETGIMVGAVGLITEPKQAEDILERGQADAVFLARAMLNDPHWALHAARALNVDVEGPVQYGRSKK